MKKRIQTNSAARFAEAVFVEDHLDSEKARQSRLQREEAIRRSAEDLRLNPRGRPIADEQGQRYYDRFPFSPVVDPEARLKLSANR